MCTKLKQRHIIKFKSSARDLNHSSISPCVDGYNKQKMSSGKHFKQSLYDIVAVSNFRWNEIQNHQDLIILHFTLYILYLIVLLYLKISPAFFFAYEHLNSL